MTATLPTPLPVPEPVPEPGPEPQAEAGPDGGPVEAALVAVRGGGFAVVVDEAAERGAEGVLVLAAQAMTAEKMAFMIRHTSGVIAVPLEGARLDTLQLPLMVADPGATAPAPATAAFTVSVDAHQGAAAGISAADRSHTVHALIDPGTKPADLARPGHVFPQRYREGGVLRRAGRGEAAVDLARLAGLQPAAVVAELVNDDGSLQQRTDLARLAAGHRLPVVTIGELIEHRRQREKLVRQVSAARVPTPYGDFTAVVFASLLDGVEHVALVRGDVAGRSDVPAHVHAECLTGDTFGSLRCDCGRRLDAALADIAAADAGVLVYLRDHVSPARSLLHELHTDRHQDHVLDDGIAAQILTDLGVRPPFPAGEQRLRGPLPAKKPA
jgi:3,4-dihydroxy 2-butanone 4-phosphate synthase/GTP cyclohydrolase II